MTEVKEAPKPKTVNAPAEGKEMTRREPTTPEKGNGWPLGLMRRFTEEMDHLFEDFGLETGRFMPRFLTRGREPLRRGAGFVPAEWSPTVEVLHREGEYVVRADLPGMSREDVKVELTDELLTIRGERKVEKKEEREGYRYSECRYGSFYRAIPLPEGVDPAKATAEFHKGVLEVAMPATPRPEEKVRRLEVREGK